MRKTLWSLGIFVMLLTTGLVTTGYSQQIPQINTQSYSVPTAGITLHKIRFLLIDHLQQLPVNPRIRIILQNSIEQGMNDIENQGISLQENLFDLNQRFSNNPLKSSFRLPHLILMNFHPDMVNISLTLSPYTINLSENETGGNTSRTLEIFIKLIPFIDSVKTEQRIILRKLYQNTALLWPSIGCRILEENTTIFIIAFGPGMQRIWRLF